MTIVQKTEKFVITSIPQLSAAVSAWIQENFPNLQYDRISENTEERVLYWFNYGDMRLTFGHFSTNFWTMSLCYEDGELIRPIHYGFPIEIGDVLALSIIDIDGKMLFASFGANGKMLNRSMCVLESVRTGNKVFFSSDPGMTATNVDARMEYPRYLIYDSTTKTALGKYPSELGELAGSLGYGNVAVSPAYYYANGDLYTHELLYVLAPNETTMYTKTQQVPISVGGHTYWYLDLDVYVRIE